MHSANNDHEPISPSGKVPIFRRLSYKLKSTLTSEDEKTEPRAVPELSVTEINFLRRIWPEDFGHLYEIGYNIHVRLIESLTAEQRKMFSFMKGFEVETTANEDPRPWTKSRLFKEQTLALVETYKKAVITLTVSVSNRTEFENFLLAKGRAHFQYEGIKQEHWDTINQITVKVMRERINTMPDLSDEDKQVAEAVWRLVANYIMHTVRRGWLLEKMERQQKQFSQSVK